MNTVNSINQNGCSVCRSGEENYVTFRPVCRYGAILYQYDYRHKDGELFTIVASSLEACREKRDKWLQKKNKAEKHIQVFSLEDAAHSVELFGYMEENSISDVSDFFTGTEADKLQIDGNIILFVRVETPQSDIIIYWDGNYETGEDRIKKILTRFFSPDFGDCFEKRTAAWSEFKDNCIAFRDGQSTFYSIWQYTGQK